MKFALLGVDADALELAQWVARSPEHELAWACEVAGAEAQLRAFAPKLQISTFWESLLAGGTADAVIVARGASEEERAEQLRKLVQAAVPMVLSHPANDSMLICYELDMIRRESGCVMLPYVPYRWHAGVRRLAALIAEGAKSDIGPAEQVVMERAMSERTRPAVQRQFASDVELLRGLCGDLTSISALAPGGKEAAEYANLGVQLAGERGLLARWSVGAVEPAAGARIVLRGAAGKATLDLPDAGQLAELELSFGGKTVRESFPVWSPAAAAIEQLESALAGREAVPTWPDACRDVELAEAIPRSLAKGRTIELHDEEHSEHGTFKGTMTSVGCGLLVASLVVLLVAAALAKITGQAIFGYAPYFILGMLGLFLVIQSLKLVFPSEE
jgi:predicted dehydrogenase